MEIMNIFKGLIGIFSNALRGLKPAQHMGKKISFFDKVKAYFFDEREPVKVEKYKPLTNQGNVEGLSNYSNPNFAKKVFKSNSQLEKDTWKFIRENIPSDGIMSEFEYFSLGLSMMEEK